MYLGQKILYLSLVRSQLTYCSPVWRSHLIKDIISLENVQRRATKFILNDFSSNYKLRLVSLGILPLMMQLDVMFCLKESSGSFNIHNFIQFCTSGTRASTYHKMRQPSSMRTNSVRHFYFNRLPRLWNSLPFIDIEHSLSSIKLLTFGITLLLILILTFHVHIIFYVHVQNVYLVCFCK